MRDGVSSVWYKKTSSPLNPTTVNEIYLIETQLFKNVEKKTQRNAKQSFVRSTNGQNSSRSTDEDCIKPSLTKTNPE